MLVKSCCVDHATSEVRGAVYTDVLTRYFGSYNISIAYCLNFGDFTKRNPFGMKKKATFGILSIHSTRHWVRRHVYIYVSVSIYSSVFQTTEKLE